MESGGDTQRKENGIKETHHQRHPADGEDGGDGQREGGRTQRGRGDTDRGRVEGTHRERKTV